MNDETRVEIERYLDGAMTPDEAARFLEALRRNPEALACLGRALEDQALLFDAVRTPAPAARRTRARRLRLAGRSAPGPGFFWMAAGVAAALFLALLTFSSGETRPRPRAPVPPPEIVTVPAPPMPAPPPEPPRPRPVPPPEPFVAPTPRPNPAVPKDEPAPPPKPPEPAPPPAPEKKTAVAVAAVDRAQGDCSLKAGDPILQGQGLSCNGAGSLAVVSLLDKTRLELGERSEIREIAQDATGKRIKLQTGTLAVDAVKQPGGTSLTIATPQAEIVVVGTKFTVSIAGDSTRVDVREGRVRVRRRSDGATTEVSAAYFALVTAGGALAATHVPVDEILLLPTAGKIQGTDWHPVKDPETGTGTALEALKGRSGPFQDAPCVVFTVPHADAGKIYHVWVRGKCLAKTSRIEHDAVMIEFTDSEVTEPPGPNKGLAGSLERGLFNGFMHTTGYGWVGSDSDQGRDVPPVTVRFNKPGRQTLKLYVTEGPVRVDALWLSATQKPRPDDAQTGPVEKK